VAWGLHNPLGMAPARHAKKIPRLSSAPAELAPADARRISALVEQLPSRTKLTNLDKVMFPDEAITKAALIAYYAATASHMLPHAARRPLALVRCPDGRAGSCFFQKHAAPGTPEVLGRVVIEEDRGRREPYLYVKDVDGLFALVQMGVLEVHLWGAHVDKLERPDRLVIDLDPDPELEWDLVVAAARDLRARLAGHRLESFVMTTGGKGLHVVAPFARRIDWGACKTFARAIAEAMARAAPDRFTANMAKAQRSGKIFVDYLRNARGATAIAPYSTRARVGATVATPISWAELERGVRPRDFTVLTLPGRLLALQRDPWQGYLDLTQRLPV